MAGKRKVVMILVLDAEGWITTATMVDDLTLRQRAVGIWEGGDKDSCKRLAVATEVKFLKQEDSADWVVATSDELQDYKDIWVQMSKDAGLI